MTQTDLIRQFIAGKTTGEASGMIIRGDTLWCRGFYKVKFKLMKRATTTMFRNVRRPHGSEKIVIRRFLINSSTVSSEGKKQLKLINKVVEDDRYQDAEFYVVPQCDLSTAHESTRNMIHVCGEVIIRSKTEAGKTKAIRELSKVVTEYCRLKESFQSGVPGIEKVITTTYLEALATAPPERAELESLKKAHIAIKKNLAYHRKRSKKLSERNQYLEKTLEVKKKSKNAFKRTISSAIKNARRT